MDGKMMKTSTNRKHSLIKAFSRNRFSHKEDKASQNAFLLMEERVQLTVGSQTQERVFLLFTDSLIIAKPMSLYIKLKAQVCLSDIWLASCTHLITSRKCSIKNSFVIGWPTINYVVTLSTAELKDKWLCALQWHSARFRQSLMSHHVSLRVQLLDSLAVTRVSVDVNTTAESVVQKVFLQNHLSGSVCDYQLCVVNNSQEETYPLMGEDASYHFRRFLYGHELPYCILLHQNSPLTLNAHRWHSADELSRDHAHSTPAFILRNKPAADNQTHTGSYSRMKKRKSLIGWVLRKGSSNQSEEGSDIHPASKKLFGQPLSTVCQDGTLPGPIKDLLCLLYRDGPETLGIFRRSANARSCRILKEKLNYGHRVSLRGESVFVAASLLTEFLRKLPGSVLNSELYDEWMHVLEEDDQKDKQNLVKSVLMKLSSMNRTLLCYVFGVLYCIHSHSEVNQMTALNLALCIAPNMLWRSTSCTPEQENHSTLQVAALIRFMIENTPSIFGDEVEDVFTALSKAAQDTDYKADASLLHSSSEDTDQDSHSSSPFSPLLDPFLPLSTLSLYENIGSPNFKVAMETADTMDSCGMLDLALTQSAKFRDLNQTRDRCRSEPSMCFQTSTSSLKHAQAPPHASVIRQSSCDSAGMDSKPEPSEGSVGLSSFIKNRKGGLFKGRYSFWKSPHFHARFRLPAQRLASMSSLSSTTTSSLSSLDSFEPVPSPSENKEKNCPFLFGSAARLHPLTPEMPRKLWSMAFANNELRDLHTFNVDDSATLSELDSIRSVNSNGTFISHCAWDSGISNSTGDCTDKSESQYGCCFSQSCFDIVSVESNIVCADDANMESLQNTTYPPVSADNTYEDNTRLKCALFSDLKTFISEGKASIDANAVTSHEIINSKTQQGNTEISTTAFSNINLKESISISANCPGLSSGSKKTTENPETVTSKHTEISEHISPPNISTHTSESVYCTDLRVVKTSAASLDNTVSSVKLCKTSRMKITMFPAVGRIIPRVKDHKSGEGVAKSVLTAEKHSNVMQVNIPQTLFYKQNVNLVLQRKTGGDVTGDASCGTSITTTDYQNTCVFNNKTDSTPYS